MKEIWEDIEGFEGYYQISNYGNIKSLKRFVYSSIGKNKRRTVPERLLKTGIDRYGYKTVTLRKNNTDKHFTVHRLIALAFIPNPNNFPSINHKDEDKLNNEISNLEWCSIRYNNLYNDRQTKINKKLLNHVNTSKIVLQYDLNNNFIQEYPSVREVCRKNTSFYRNTIQNCCLGNTKTAYNYIWKYK